MKKLLDQHKKTVLGLGAVLLLGAITMSFQDTPYLAQFLQEKKISDTIPEKKEGSMTMKQFDELNQQLDKTMQEVSQSLKTVDMKLVQEQAAAALKQVDVDKIMKDVELSLKSIDIEKTLADVKASLKDVDYERINVEVKKEILEAKKEMEKAQLEIKKIDKEAIKKDLANAQKDIERSRDEIKKIDMDKIMAEARTGIDKAKSELKLTKQMFTEMEKEGLIDPKKGFTIEYREKELYINGAKQIQQVTDRYRPYFHGDHFKITIDKE
ncbi:MAG: hypothetical protein JWQ27_3049 [Ferruginibacter sp.]|nr:hypothetical protein [Ferruginibacter sp.]